MRAQIEKFNRSIEEGLKEGVKKFQTTSNSAIDSVRDIVKEEVESFDPTGRKTTDRKAMKARDLALEPDAAASEASREIEELRFFREKMEAFMVEEQERAAQEEEEVRRPFAPGLPLHEKINHPRCLPRRRRLALGATFQIRI